MSGSAARLTRMAIFSLIALIAPRDVAAQETGDQTCLMCHQNPNFWRTRADGQRFVVSRSMIDRSAHARLECTDCHVGLTFPHPENPPRVRCGRCHGRQAREHGESLHGRAASRGDPLAPECTDCHGTHDVLPPSNPQSPTNVMNIPLLCGECHHEGTEVSRTRNIPEERILENYSLSIHGTGLFRMGLTVTAVCTSCHTSHFILPHTDPRSSIHRDNVARTCTQCHARIEEVHVKVIEGKLWEEEPHKIPACVDCHSPHRIRRVFYDAGVANQDCLRCHADRELVVERDSVQHTSLYVDEQAYNASAHGGTGCAQCHTDVTSVFQERPCETVAPASRVDCSICHAEQVDEYTQSTHGTLAAAGDPDAPHCLDCHEKHATQSKGTPRSPTFPRNVPELCARCHRAGEAAAKRIPSAYGNIVQSYEMSIHGKGLLESGLVVTATCTSCHGAHSELPPDDPRSRVHRDNIADTCGSCHNGIKETFQTSIHWPGNGEPKRGHPLPTCEDCHTSHSISRTDRADFRLLMMNQCGRCHEPEAETFFDTYHGKVSRLGGVRAAKCYDCHGTHDILPPDDPRSTLSQRNIVRTCSQCHSRANLKFTGYLTHATHHDPDRYPWLFGAFWAMTGLLVGTLSFALAHTGAWLWRLWRSPEEWKIRQVAVRRSSRQYRRFTAFQRSLHIVMMLSFMALALTGMALKFSFMGWAQVFADLVGGFEAMGVLHRLGATALITIFVIHLVDVFKQRRRAGKTWKEFLLSRDSLVFNRDDWEELKASIRWFLGRGPRPPYGRYTYWEKFDYFAVFWGMMVIGSTGLFLWFPEFFTLLLPGSLVNVATIIHSDEALLAVAFIFTIHFFNTHFRLDKFPMDPVIFTGRVDVQELKRDKPREYERMMESGEFERRLVDPYPERVELAFRIFGFTMLGIGLLLIGLILYSMLFGYR